MSNAVGEQGTGSPTPWPARWLALSSACSILSLPILSALFARPVYPTVPHWADWVLTYALQVVGFLAALHALHISRGSTARQASWLVLGMSVAAFAFLVVVLFIPFAILGR